jgi:hypothetical protein
MRFDVEGYPTPFNKFDFWQGTVRKVTGSYRNESS